MRLMTTPLQGLKHRVVPCMSESIHDFLAANTSDQFILKTFWTISKTLAYQEHKFKSEALKIWDYFEHVQLFPHQNLKHLTPRYNFWVNAPLVYQTGRYICVMNINIDEVGLVGFKVLHGIVKICTLQSSLLSHLIYLQPVTSIHELQLESISQISS